MLAAPEDRSTAGLRAALIRGREIADAANLDARRDLAGIRCRFWDAIGDNAILLMPPTPGTAPEGQATGNPRFIIPLNALAGPITSVPVGFDDNRRPLGVMLGGRPGDDLRFAALACDLARAIELPR